MSMGKWGILGLVVAGVAMVAFAQEKGGEEEQATIG